MFKCKTYMWQSESLGLTVYMDLSDDLTYGPVSLSSVGFLTNCEADLYLLIILQIICWIHIKIF